MPRKRKSSGRNKQGLVTKNNKSEPYILYNWNSREDEKGCSIRRNKKVVEPG